jgi:signal transduction histidine kinase
MKRAFFNTVAEQDGEASSATHLTDAERALTWTRMAAFAGWGAILYAQGYRVQLDAVWVSYAIGVVYMALLHWWVRKDGSSRVTSWAATLCDSAITFLMCLVTGGAASPFFPFFYFTTLAGAFRFGVSEMAQILLLNGAAIVGLHALRGPHGIGPTLLTLYYLGFAAALGALLAGWARANLEIALSRSSALRVERDRSNALLHKLIDTQEEERKRLAGDLHDRMGARLFQLQHQLDQCSRHEAAARHLGPQFVTMRKDLIDCNSDVRSLMNELRPNVLDDFGFLEALSEYVTGLVGVVEFTIEVRVDTALRGWRSRQDAMLFRLLQEALLNVRKHAGATGVIIAVNRWDRDIVLSIEDNGCGFDPAQIPVGHFGIMMMRERAQAAGGALTIDAQPGRGATISINFPATTP